MGMVWGRGWERGLCVSILDLLNFFETHSKSIIRIIVLLSVFTKQIKHISQGLAHKRYAEL